MTQAAEQIARQFANSGLNKKEYGKAFYWVTVYGAKGNGVADDTSKIQAAIDAAYADGGGAVLFPDGVYCCWNLAMKANVVLVGNKGATLKRINNAAQLHWIEATSVTNFGIINLILDGNKSLAPSYPYTDTISFKDSGQFELEGLTIKNSVNRGIYIEKNTDVTIDKNSKIEKCFVTASGSANIWLRDCSELTISRNSLSSSMDNGIVVEYTASRYASGNTVRIEHNKVFKNGVNGIWCYSDAVDRHIPISIVNIDRNEVHDNGQYGIITNINESYITDNDVHDNGGAGIMANTTKVTITGGATERNGDPGIDLGDCYDVIVQGVIIEENATLGIEVNSCEDVVIDSCIIQNNNKTSKAGPFGANNAIYIYQGTDGDANPFPGISKNVQVKNCIIRRKVGYFQDVGIRVGNTSERVSLIGNDVYDSGNTDDFRIETVSCLMDGNVSKRNDYNHAQASIVSASDIFIPPDGDVFFIDGNATVKNIFTSGFGSPTQPAITGRKITLILTNQLITLFAGDGNTTGNLLNSGDLSISGFFKIVEYICIGGSWLQYMASAGR